MASTYAKAAAHARPALTGGLADARFAIASPWFDALFFWGAPLASLLAVWAWVGVALALPAPAARAGLSLLGAAVGVLTFAHLLAVAPRAYLNAQVFADNRRRLLIVPPLLVATLLASPTALICAGILAVLWDVHHSAMQTFGLSRIYDMKAGNDATTLRATDLRLNWALYVGPIAAGASLLVHFARFANLKSVNWTRVAGLPGFVEHQAGIIAVLAISAWAAIVGWALVDYRRAIAAGYRLPVHKAVLVGVTGLVSILAYGFQSPFVALASVNIFHAVQYFALVWLKEGGRTHGAAARLVGRSGPERPGWLSFAIIAVPCTGFGVAYWYAQDSRLLLAPFVACSLLHFWFDSFVWSVRKKQV